MIEHRWAAISLQGVDMKRTNLPFFYLLGTQLNAVARMELPYTSRAGVVWAAFEAARSIAIMLETFPDLTMCRPIVQEFVQAYEDIRSWSERIDPKNLQQPDSQADILFNQVINKARQLETVLLAELPALATFTVTQKGIYSTNPLIESAELALPEPAINKVKQDVKYEIQQSGRCLAFELPTASAFHMMRAIEAVMHDFFLSVCKPSKKPATRFVWGEYIAKFRDSSDLHAKQVAELLQHIKDLNRNPIMHPEVVLQPGEAFELFELAKSAIIIMADRLPDDQEKA